MEMDILTYTKKKVEELEHIKKATKFYQEKEDILTMTLDELFSRTGIYPSTIPVDFILRIHGSEESRGLYVFDCLDIRDTNRCYPEGMSVQAYDRFVDITNEALRKVELSVNMKMLDEQREYFDKLVRTREEEAPTHEELCYQSWKNIVKRIIFATVPDAVRPYLQKKHAQEVEDIAEYVMKKCDGKRQSTVRVREIIEEYLSSMGMKMSELRKFDWEEFEKSRGRRR